MRLDLFVKLKYELRTIILFVGILSDTLIFPYRSFKHSKWWRHIRSRIQYLIQAYCILMLIL